MAYGKLCSMFPGTLLYQTAVLMIVWWGSRTFFFSTVDQIYTSGNASSSIKTSLNKQWDHEIDEKKEKTVEANEGLWISWLIFEI